MKIEKEEDKVVGRVNQIYVTKSTVSLRTASNVSGFSSSPMFVFSGSTQVPPSFSFYESYYQLYLTTKSRS